MTRLDTLDAEFGTKVALLLDLVEKATGREWAISDARRTMSRQDALYSQGRTTAGKVVTMARGGESPHNFGLAADLWPMRGGDFDWGADDALFATLAGLAEGLGLVAGYNFTHLHDGPHVESQDWRVSQTAWKRGELRVA
jgi:peptidoglycan L-alanyl-D-glutamate endopeptidase CwlK